MMINLFYKKFINISTYQNKELMEVKMKKFPLTFGGDDDDEDDDGCPFC